MLSVLSPCPEVDLLFHPIFVGEMKMNFVFLKQQNSFLKTKSLTELKIFLVHLD